MTEKTKTILYCIECGEETTHTINYLGDNIRSVHFHFNNTTHMVSE